MSNLIRRQENLIEASIDGEVVMMNADSGNYYGLDGIAAHIWQLLETPQTEQDLVNALVKEYEVTPEECESDVTAFLQEMRKNDVLSSAS